MGHGPTFGGGLPPTKVLSVMACSCGYEAHYPSGVYLNNTLLMPNSTTLSERSWPRFEIVATSNQAG
jgi:hypothetical protein